MNSNAPRCELCGTTFTGVNDLERHQLEIHADSGSQCESCGKIFDDEEELLNHVKAAHAVASGLNPNPSKDEKLDELQSELLKKADEEEKARKRTHGPYRKSAAA
jgi:uncharacterized C2H2 Zn-finger protein